MNQELRFVAKSAEDHLRQYNHSSRLKQLAETIKEEMSRTDWSVNEVKLLLKELLNASDGVHKRPNRLYRSTGIGNAPDETFWRVREYSHGMHKEGVRACWEPPPERVKGGRLNGPGESMLYVARYPLVATLESGVWSQSGRRLKGRFLLSAFGIQSGKGVSFSRIPWGTDRADMLEHSEQLRTGADRETSLTANEPLTIPDAETTAKLEVMDDILGFLMTRPNSDSKGHQISQHVLREHFPLTTELDGWVYPTLCDPAGGHSDETRQEMNICMLPATAHNKLELREAAILATAPNYNAPRIVRSYRPDGDRLLEVGNPEESPLINTAVAGSFEQKWGYWKMVQLNYISDESAIVWPHASQPETQ